MNALLEKLSRPYWFVRWIAEELRIVGSKHPYIAFFAQVIAVDCLIFLFLILAFCF